MAPQVPHPGKTTRLNSLKTERQAQWIVDRWSDRPSLSRQTMLAEVRKAFDCGKTAAEQAMKRAYEMIREETDATDASVVASHLKRLAENAERRGNDAQAAQIWDRYARIVGAVAPTKIAVEHSGAVTNVDVELKVKELSTEQLEALAALEGDDE